MILDRTNIPKGGNPPHFDNPSDTGYPEGMSSSLVTVAVPGLPNW